MAKILPRLWAPKLFVKWVPTHLPLDKMAIIVAEDIFKRIFLNEQGKSEGFESCDRPIVRKRPIWVKIGDV